MTIDETIYPFWERIFFRVYIVGKPRKYGLKIFELCEAKSGYVYNLEVRRLEKLWRNMLQCTAENVTLDFVWDCVLKCITQNWITGSKSDNII
jgi:hypothetical protein